MCGACTPIEHWHSQQNKRCRSTVENLEFTKKQGSGGCWPHLLDTLKHIQSFSGLSYMHFPMTKDSLEPGILSADNPVIEFENDMASLALEMAPTFHWLQTAEDPVVLQGLVMEVLLDGGWSGSWSAGGNCQLPQVRL